MSEMDKIHRYLQKIFNEFEAWHNQPKSIEYYQVAKSLAVSYPTKDLLSPEALEEPYSKNRSRDRASEAYISNLIIFIKAKQSFEKNNLQKSIDLLFTYHLQLGRIQQNITEEDGFKEKESRRSKAGTDKLYGPDRAIREEVCKLLQKHKPEEGWKDRTAAAKSVFPDLERFFKANCSGSNLKLENLDSYINKWMKNSKYEPYDAFKETASLEWLRKNHKSNC